MDIMGSKKKYDYLKIKDLFEYNDLKSDYLINFYAILIRQGTNLNQVIFLIDEDNIELKVKLDEKTFVNLKNYFLPGNIIRFHRIKISKNKLIECKDEKSIVIFEVYKENLTYKTLAENPSIQIEDFERVKQLETWWSDKIINSSIENLRDSKIPDYFNLCCQLISKKKISQHAIIIEILDGSGESNKKRYVEIIVYDVHLENLEKIDLLQYIVMINLEINSIKNNTTIMLRGNYLYGKCIRLVERKSILGKKLTEKLKKKDESLVDDEIKNSSIIKKNEMERNTIKNVLYDWKNEIEYNLYCYLKDYFPGKNQDINISDLVYYSCKRCSIFGPVHTFFIASLSNFIRAINEIYYNFEGRKNVEEEIYCFNCNEEDCIKLVFNIPFILKDENSDELIAVLGNDGGMELFGCTALECLIEKNKEDKVWEILKILTSGKYMDYLVSKWKNIYYINKINVEF